MHYLVSFFIIYCATLQSYFFLFLKLLFVNKWIDITKTLRTVILINIKTRINNPSQLTSKTLFRYYLQKPNLYLNLLWTSFFNHVASFFNKLTPHVTLANLKKLIKNWKMMDKQFWKLNRERCKATFTLIYIWMVYILVYLLIYAF